MSAIILSNQNLPLVEYKGQRVVTFAMVDQAHQRPNGTAKAAFNRNKTRFTEGKHYFSLNADQIRDEVKATGYVKRTQLDGKATSDVKRRQMKGVKTTEGIKRTQLVNELFPKHTKSGIVITEMGYLLLVKPFTDELSWQIQEQLVEAYFRPNPHFSDIRPVLIPSLEELEAMPLSEAQNLLAAAEHKSKWRHGKHGSAEMTQRKRELKVIRPAIERITALVQLTIPELGAFK
ncbi:toxin Bro [bacteria symbiont BFo2 of Frankliniella occidentalis]|nr:toxin Bro [bacteria symbiont BFo2 of Frankliniella occidentalis]KYP92545.1 toxin Bro [bacteria symbiont BFo2 of Frankliniella occidentalis]KYP94207.1 toxin Bro [bacteria symbiont BFo2 of Frankliniella occidentalis]